MNGMSVGGIHALQYVCFAPGIAARKSPMRVPPNDHKAKHVRQWEDIGAGAKPFDSTSALMGLDLASAGSVT